MSLLERLAEGRDMDFVSKDKGKKEMQELFQTSNVQHANNFEDIPQELENG